MILVDIAIFAHNEEENIGSMMDDLARQSICADPEFSVRVYVLANGCVDRTVEISRNMASVFPYEGMVRTIDLPDGGKSRTWNSFVHSISRRETEFLVCCDADIALPQRDAIGQLVAFLQARNDIDASSSRPVKDIDFAPARLSFTERLISAGGGSMGSIGTAICGQLYIMRSALARELHIPIGLPVEDGFIRHSIITAKFGPFVSPQRIDQSDVVMHLYASERQIGSLLKHQIRIVIGGAINAALFRHLTALHKESGPEAVERELQVSASDPTWLLRTLQARLPDRRFGWVPWPFLMARTQNLIRNGRRTPRGLMLAIAGFVFDLIVFISAQGKMARGAGPGYW